MNAGGIHSVVIAYVVGFGTRFDLLLSKCWLRRHQAVEDHGADTLTLRAKSGVTITIPLAPAVSPIGGIDYPTGADIPYESERSDDWRVCWSRMHDGRSSFESVTRRFEARRKHS